MLRAGLRWKRFAFVGCVVGLLAFGLYLILVPRPLHSEESEPLDYKRRLDIDTSGCFSVYTPQQPSWAQASSLEEVAAAHEQHLAVALATAEELLQTGSLPSERVLLIKASLLHSQGKAAAAYEVLDQLERQVRGGELEADYLYTVIFFKGVTALRIAETENCILCRGASSCIFPLAPTAIHTNPAGSRLAIEHFGDYLKQFPDDLEVKWLLNLAHMTLVQHPLDVDPRHRLSLDAFAAKSAYDINHGVVADRAPAKGALRGHRRLGSQW